CHVPTLRCVVPDVTYRRCVASYRRCVASLRCVAPTLRRTAASPTRGNADVKKSPHQERKRATRGALEPTVRYDGTPPDSARSNLSHHRTLHAEARPTATR